MKKILSSFPDYGKAPPEYLVNLIEAVAYLGESDVLALLHPVHGLATRCQYLPTIADVHALLAERRAKAEQFRPAATAYHKLIDKPDAPWNRETDYERKRRVVRELLGYDPADQAKPVRRELVEPSADDLRNLVLKSPVKPVTPQLRELLVAQGWLDPASAETAPHDR